MHMVRYFYTLSVIFTTLCINASASCSAERMPEEAQNTLSECPQRMKIFIDKLFELNPQIPDFQKDKFQPYYNPLKYGKLASLPTLSLIYLNIKILPKEIGSLNGCITSLLLQGNTHLTLENIPSAIAKLEDVRFGIYGTPLENIFGRTCATGVQISREKQPRETAIFSSFVLAPQGGLTSKEGTPLPWELRKQILNTMETKRAQERDQEETKDLLNMLNNLR